MKRGLFRTVNDQGSQNIVWSDSVEQDVRYYRHLAMILPSRSQLIRDSSLTKTDLLEIAT